jgi:4-hydroxy-4-methyl-2-oxoglutarate aldolase
MSDPLAERLKHCYTGAVHDVMRAMGLEDFTLPAALRPLFPDQTLAGPAKPGHIWVSQPNDRKVAHMGELSAETLKNKGVLGCVTDGFVRDVNFLIDIGFQTWSRGYTPRDIVGYWLPKAVETDILIGDVLIAPGDYLLGDRDGLVRVPKGIVGEVVAGAETAIATESKVRSAILSGVDPQEAYLRYGKF